LHAELATARSAAVSAHVLVHGRTRAVHGAWLAWARVRLLTSPGHRAGAVNVLATVVAIVVVDRGGRKILFTQGGIQMAAAEIAMAGLIAWNFRPGAGELSQSVRSGTPRAPERVLAPRLCPSTRLACQPTVRLQRHRGPCAAREPSCACPDSCGSSTQALLAFMTMLVSRVGPDAFTHLSVLASVLLISDAAGLPVAACRGAGPCCHRHRNAALPHATARRHPAGPAAGARADRRGVAPRAQMAVGIIVLVCIFTSGFAWSWGPLGWLVPSEIQPLETRSTGQAITVSVNFIFTAVIGQAFLTMLCTMQYGIFLFFAGCVAIMTLFVLVFLPGAPCAARQRPARRCAAHAGQRRSMFARPHVLGVVWSQGAVPRCMPA